MNPDKETHPLMEALERADPETLSFKELAEIISLTRRFRRAAQRTLQLVHATPKATRHGTYFGTYFISAVDPTSRAFSVGRENTSSPYFLYDNRRNPVKNQKEEGYKDPEEAIQNAKRILASQGYKIVEK